MPFCFNEYFLLIFRSFFYSLILSMFYYILDFGDKKTISMFFIFTRAMENITIVIFSNNINNVISSINTLLFWPFVIGFLKFFVGLLKMKKFKSDKNYNNC